MMLKKGFTDFLNDAEEFDAGVLVEELRGCRIRAGSLESGWMYRLDLPILAPLPPFLSCTRLNQTPPSSPSHLVNRPLWVAPLLQPNKLSGAKQYIPTLSMPTLADPPIKMYFQPSFHAAAVAAVRINDVNPPSALQGIQVILSVNDLRSPTTGIRPFAIERRRRRSIKLQLGYQRWLSGSTRTSLSPLLPLLSVSGLNHPPPRCFYLPSLLISSSGTPVATESVPAARGEHTRFANGDFVEAP
ncbi:hypothetical protein BD410DRAFT_801198 [Rickenella mellea]|uniref:Uncharacterized protein n=1 Tax=Rickenella mellea TaxID=50990 RepID=A0A4Y7QCY0_9AGAM|nr:hypothetical protein BD410DRAFT_801198 [Rickenella mellea]